MNTPPKTRSVHRPLIGFGALALLCGCSPSTFGARAVGQAQPGYARVQVEVLALMLDKGRIYLLRPQDVPSWQTPFRSEAHPHDTVLRALEARQLEPALIHSTSWRYQHDTLVLTYIAVLNEPPAVIETFRLDPVIGGRIARGSAMAPPKEISSAAVVDHAVQHLAHLARQDGAVQRALTTAWKRALQARYFSSAKGPK